IPGEALVRDVRIVLKRPCWFHQVDVPGRLGSSQGHCKLRRQPRGRSRKRGEINVVGDPPFLVVGLEPGAKQRAGLKCYRCTVIEGAVDMIATLISTGYPVRVRSDLHGQWI